MSKFKRESVLINAPRRSALKLGLAGTLVLALSCSVSTAFAAEKPKVGLIMKSLSNEFFKQMKAGADKYAAENKDKFDFKAVGMPDCNRWP